MSSYWDLDDFLCEGMRITVNFVEDCKQLAFLSTGLGKEDEDLPKGSRIDLPMHLTLQLGRISVIDFEAPYVFGLEFKELLAGDPLLINIRAKNKYFYKVALRLSDKLIQNDLLEEHATAFLVRMVELIKLAQFSECYKPIRNKLTETENDIYEAARSDAINY